MLVRRGQLEVLVGLREDPVVFPDGVGVLLILFRCPRTNSTLSSLHVREAGIDVRVGAEVGHEVIHWIGRLLLPGLPCEQGLPLNVYAGGGGEGTKGDECFHFLL